MQPAAPDSRPERPSRSQAPTLQAFVAPASPLSLARPVPAGARARSAIRAGPASVPQAVHRRFKRAEFSIQRPSFGPARHPSTRRVSKRAVGPAVPSASLGWEELLQRTSEALKNAEEALRGTPSTSETRLHSFAPALFAAAAAAGAAASAAAGGAGGMDASELASQASALAAQFEDVPLAAVAGAIALLSFAGKPFSRGGKLSADPERYDAERIAAFAAANPLLVAGRALEVSLSFGLFYGIVAFDAWTGRTEQRIGYQAEYLRRLLTRLGPTYIKLGQSLSCRPDLVRRDYLDELVLLQDQLPSFDCKIAFQTFREEIGREPSEIFSEISPEPVAAASLGQVYRCRLKTGEEVALKVQRPGLKPTLFLDLHLLRSFAPALSRVLPIQLGCELTAIVDEFGRSLFDELDYVLEAANAARFETLFAGDATIKIPHVYPEFSSKRVLVLEWIDGFKANDADNVEKAGLDSNELIRVGVTAGLRQLLEYGFFHADPHPGNIFAMRDGRLAYIDFGMMAELSQEAKETLVDALVHLVNEDYFAVVEDFVKLKFLPQDTEVATIVPALRKIWKDAIGESVRDFNFKSVTDRFSDLVYRYPFRVPAEFALVIRSLLVQEGISLALNPDFRILEVAYPYVATRLLTDESPRLRRRLIEVLFKDGRFQWGRLENLIGIAMLGGGLDLKPTARLAIDYVMGPEGAFLRRELVNALTEDDRLHLEELRRLWDLLKGEVDGDLIRVAASSVASNTPGGPLLATAASAAAAALARGAMPPQARSAQ
eukprot:tig00020938_g16134.t1